MPTDAPKLLALIERELRSAPTRDGDTYKFTVAGELDFTVTEQELEDLAASIQKLQHVGDNAVSTDYSFEMLVRSADARGIPLRAVMSDGDLILNDEHQGVTYTLGKASPEFLFMILISDERSELISPMYRSNRAFRVYGSGPFSSAPRDESEPRSLLTAMQEGFPYIAVRLESERKKTQKSMLRLAEAFQFHIGFNTDTALVPRSWKRNPLRTARLRRVGRSGMAGLDVPRRMYVKDLVHHYQLGISSESPMLQYLSFYHVAEHWFESIYQDDLVDQIQGRLTGPSFSFRRKKDIQDLIKHVNRAIQLRNEELIINEEVALRLTLAKYVDLTQLVADLALYDKDALDYLSCTKVPFSDGNLVDLTCGDTNIILTALSRRIYKTRNSIVHSKEGARGRFVPYSDDHALTPEIPLMRLIAEQIIVATSEEQPA